MNRFVLNIGNSSLIKEKIIISMQGFLAIIIDRAFNLISFFISKWKLLSCHHVTKGRNSV